MYPLLTRCVGYHPMATNKPHFRLTTYGKLNPGDLAVELHWAIPEAVKIKSIITHGGIMTITLTNGTWMIRRPTDKCLASW